MPDITTDALASIRTRFLARLQNQLQDIDWYLSSLENGAEVAAPFRNIRVISHKIAGLAETVGYPALGRKAADVDQLIHEFFTGNGDREVAMKVFEKTEELADVADRALSSEGFSENRGDSRSAAGGS